MKLKAFLSLVLLVLFNAMPVSTAFSQRTAFEKSRLTTADGLPQSYVSGLTQDRQGFIWIATRDGLARYDGRAFRLYRHELGNPATLAANTITLLYQDKSERLWILFEGGELDVFDIRTEEVRHLTQEKPFEKLKGKVRNSNSIVHSGGKLYFILSLDGGIFKIDLGGPKLTYSSRADLGIADDPITGIGNSGQNLLLSTNSKLLKLDSRLKTVWKSNYDFPYPCLYDPKHPWRDHSPYEMKNGNILVFDNKRLIVFFAAKGVYKEFPLPTSELFVHPAFFEVSKSELYFANNGQVFKLVNDKVNRLDIRAPENEGIASLLYDKSGVLWLGTNGYGLRQIDLRLPRMAPFSCSSDFTERVLTDQLNISSEEIGRSPLANINPYSFRWVYGKDGRLWMSRAGVDAIAAPNICYYQKGKLISENWKFSDKDEHTRLSGLTVSQTGKLWGIDHYMRIIALDPLSRTAVTAFRLPLKDVSRFHEISGFVMDGEDTFWFTTSLGFFKYNSSTGILIKLQNVVSQSDFTTLVNDPDNKNVLWIGTKGSGLIRFDKRTNSLRIFNVTDGLPNNTIYSIIPADKLLWCSTNKGIFSLNPLTKTVRSYTTSDGLPVDEFNRFHHLKLPDGRLAFGGTTGYTVFNPELIAGDSFSPYVMLTGLKINNMPVQFGKNALRKSLNSLDTLELPHKENFLEFEFAGNEFNISEKLNYRYRMEGLDKDWVYTGKRNVAAYTDVEPGEYRFTVNVTNTAGSWSPYVRKLVLIIKPPFWKTWWFNCIIFMLCAAVVFAFLKLRTTAIRKQEQQKHSMELEVMQLEAQALRAQMNPHFVFNCLNSIKSLIQENKDRQAVKYLTTFSKLIRTQMGSLKQQVSLFEELETCRLYVELEKLRFGDKIAAEFRIPENIDLHSFSIPPLIFQPLIENAIWHGILPKSEGKVVVELKLEERFLLVCVEDDGIGRERSFKNKPRNVLHDSKGLSLLRKRLEMFALNTGVTEVIKIIDLTNDDGEAGGTRVTVKLSLND